MSLQKKTSLVIQRKVAEALSRRLPALLVNQDFAVGGIPTVTVSEHVPVVAGEQNAFVQVIELPGFGTQSTGMAAEPYSPHVIQVAVEESATAGETLLSLANLSVVLLSTLAPGSRVELYMEANGTEPTASSIDPTKLVQTLDLDLMFGVFAGK